MRKLLVGLFAAGVVALSTTVPTFAANISDVGSDYWATTEINNVVDNNVMTLYSGARFNPEGTVSRVEFVHALLKVLTNDNLDVKISNIFSDIKAGDSYYDDVLRSQQLGLVYGYPDGTFKPNKLMSRAETQSVISHITKDMDSDTSVLKNFVDAEEIPEWATNVYAKTLNYGIYVNYPNPSELRPNDVLSRAEAAVILYRLRQKAGLIKSQFVGAELEKVLGTEHLNAVKKAPNDEVVITNRRNIIKEGNAMYVAFDEKFKSELAQEGEALTFVANEDLVTEEGTTLFPVGTKFYGNVISITDPKWFNKNARVYAQITKAVLPNGQIVSMNAKPFYKNYELKEGPWMTAGKLTLCTLTGGAVGTGAGIGFGFIPNPDRLGTGVGIGAPVGAAIGLATGLITKGLNYHAKEGEEIKVIMLNDVSIAK
jgi:hypothetical protein